MSSDSDVRSSDVRLLPALLLTSYFTTSTYRITYNLQFILYIYIYIFILIFYFYYQAPFSILILILRFGLYKILFHFEALLHNNIFCKHPLSCAIYCTILPVIAPPRPILRCFSNVWRCLEVIFLLFCGRIVDGWRCMKKKSFSTRKRGHYCTLLCNTPLPAPLYCLQYCAIDFPHDPLYCNK